jgi:hypothetical protein
MVSKYVHARIYGSVAVTGGSTPFGPFPNKAPRGPGRSLQYTPSHPKARIKSIVEGEVNHLAGGLAHDNWGGRSQLMLDGRTGRLISY